MPLPFPSPGPAGFSRSRPRCCCLWRSGPAAFSVPAGFVVSLTPSLRVHSRCVQRGGAKAAARIGGSESPCRGIGVASSWDRNRPSPRTGCGKAARSAACG